MSRLSMSARAYFLNTGLGIKARRIKYYLQHTYAGAYALVNKTWPNETEEEKKRIAKDMLNEAHKYQVVFDEYIFHRFRNKSQEERRAYIPIMEGAAYCDRLNNPKNKYIFDDKGETYRVFGKYFHREQVKIVKWNNEETNELRSFIERHPRFIAKPYDGANGVGIRIVDLAEEGPVDTLIQTLRGNYPKGFVAEELIIQAKTLSAVNPSSVNTLRLITIRMNDRVEVLPGAWRCGTGGRCVDNGGSGGIFCILDDDGIIYRTADEHGNSYEEHPDTKHPLIGFQVPRYKEARELVVELSAIVPDNRYCGWDLALTEEGWVLQEANARGGIVAIQTPMGRGLRKEMDALLTELGLPATKY